MSHAVSVSVATMWTSPRAPRAGLDDAVVADLPDVAAWLSLLDAEGTAERRLGLHGRTLTQLLQGDPVVVREEREGWSRVVAPWQASSGDELGYPGWIRSAHLVPAAPDAPAPPRRETTLDPEAVIATARQFLGIRYLWGGTSPLGLDCSGLVHLTLRAHQVLLPRDAFDQADSALVTRVPLDEVRPGDLYFFARPGRPVHHVGLVSAAAAPGGVRRMLHAPDSGAVRHVVEEALPAERLATLVGAARLPRHEGLAPA